MGDRWREDPSYHVAAGPSQTVYFEAALRKAARDVAAVPGVGTALIAGRDGLLVIGGQDQGDRSEMGAALAAAAFGAIDRALSNMELGPVRAALVETVSHALQIVSVGDLLLVAVAERGANMGLIRGEIAKAAYTLAQLIGPP